MFDFAWSELALIGLVAVFVLGPKELPNAMRAMGRFTRQARKLAGEFQGHVNDLMREAELEEVRTSVQKITSTNVNAEVEKLLDPTGDFAAELDRTEREMREALAAKPSDPTPAVADPPQPTDRVEPGPAVVRPPPGESAP